MSKLEGNSFVGKIKEYLEEKFYFGPMGVIGIDIGLASIKLAEVTKTNDGFRVNRFCNVDLPEGTIIEDEIHKEDELLRALQEGIKNLNSSNKFVCLSLSGPNTIIKRLQMAVGTKEEIEDNILWEIEQYLPFPLDDANISFSIVGENKGGGVDVIIGAARKDLVNAFKDIIERVGLKVKIIDLGIAAMMNVFETVYNEELFRPNSTWILMDLGAQKVEFLIYKNRAMVFSKQIPTGGLTITEEIQRQMGVNYLEAESLKIFGDGNGNVPEEIVEIVNQVLDSFFSEVKKTIDFWTTSSSDEQFDGCFITGGGALIPGFAEALQEIISTEVTILNPFNKFTYNQNNISEDDAQFLAQRGIVSLGLAMRTVTK